MRWMGTVSLCLLLLSSPGLAESGLFVREASKEIRLTGYTRNERCMKVSSEVGGRVLAVHYDVGQTIGKAPFVEVDSTFVDFDIENTLQSLRKLETNQRKAQSRVDYLTKEFHRIDKLHKGDRETEVRRDASFQELDQARLDLDSLAHEHASLQIALRELKERKERHRVFVPEGWIVTSRTVEPGAMIVSGQSLGTVSNYNELVVPLTVSGEELEALQRQAGELDVELEGKPAKAAIHWVNPEFDESTRKLKIELMILGNVPQKRGGLHCVLPLSVRAEGLFVPRAAVVSRYENPKVTIKDGGEVVQLLVLGDSDDGVFVAENARLKPGMELLPAQGDRKASSP